MSNHQHIKEESGKDVGPSLFTSTDANGCDDEDNGQMENFAEQFKDKVKLIHEHFDRNQDGYLNFDELSNLQLCTCGQSLDSTVYGHLCAAFGCQPEKGLSLDGLKLTYASEGTDLDEDYEKIFGKSHKELKLKIHPKVKAIHNHFDTNEDGYLNFDEISKLQLCTSGQPLDENVYHQLCVQFGCDVCKGLSVEGLNMTYATEVTNLDEDFEKVFGLTSTADSISHCKNEAQDDVEGNDDVVENTNENEEVLEFKIRVKVNKEDGRKDSQSGDEKKEEVFEIGEDGGIDISPDT